MHPRTAHRYLFMLQVPTVSEKPTCGHSSKQGELIENTRSQSSESADRVHLLAFAWRLQIWMSRKGRSWNRNCLGTYDRVILTHINKRYSTVNIVYIERALSNATQLPGKIRYLYSLPLKICPPRVTYTTWWPMQEPQSKMRYSPTIQLDLRNPISRRSTSISSVRFTQQSLPRTTSLAKMGSPKQASKRTLVSYSSVAVPDISIVPVHHSTRRQSTA